jgi:cell division protein FtsW (lipid II flippase)
MSQSVGRHPEVIAYLDRVCLQIKAKETHEDIRLEMLSHLEDLAAEKVEHFESTKEVAIEESLRQMGDPERVGKQLNDAHKPKPEWSVITIVTGMIVIGLVSVYALQLSLSGELLLGRKLLCGFMGVAFMIILYFVNYQRLLRYSWLLYGMTLLLMASTQLQDIPVNGAVQWLNIGPFGFNIYAVSPYLLIVAIAGILQRQKPSVGFRQQILPLTKELAIYIMIPLFFYLMAPAFVYLVIYGIGLAVLLLVVGKRKLLLIGFGALVLMLIPLLFGHSFWQRYTDFLHQDAFETLRSVEVIQSGGIWGQGFGVFYGKLPNMSSDLMYSYLVYSLGWVFGIAVAMIALLFIVRTTRMGVKLKDDYAKSLVVGLTTVLGIQLAWNLLMCAGLLPILGIGLPIMNWSSGTMIELAAVGLMLGAYRRKDMLGHNQGSSFIVY